jgi:hypothetical protein
MGQGGLLLLMNCDMVLVVILCSYKFNPIQHMGGPYGPQITYSHIWPLYRQIEHMGDITQNVLRFDGLVWLD